LIVSHCSAIVLAWVSVFGCPFQETRTVTQKKPAKATIEAPEPEGRVSVIHLQGPTEERAWLTLANKRTHLPKATIVRLALQAWGSSKGLPPYPIDMEA
jgi:hypothetical protein